LGVADLEAVLIEDVDVLLRRWRRECAGRPEVERSRLLLLALEREQIVAVAYREEAVAGRVAELNVGDQVRALIRQTLVWIWKDEQLHAEYTRGLLLEAGGLASSLVVYGRQVQGALSGWTSSTATNRTPRSAPLRTGAAGVLVAAAKAARRMPPALAKELCYQTFHKYCALNVALESSAEFAYGGRPGRGGLRGHPRPAHRPGRALPGSARRPALAVTGAQTLPRRRRPRPGPLTTLTPRPAAPIKHHRRLARAPP
jgi:hypothetical protein